MSATSSTRLSPSPNLLQVNEPRRYGSTLSLEEKCEQSFFLFYYYRMEDEAVLDRGASLLKHLCDEEEVEGESISFNILVCDLKKQNKNINRVMFWSSDQSMSMEDTHWVKQEG